MKTYLIVIWAALFVCSGVTGQADGAESKLKGYMFGEYYYVTSGAKKKENGFRFRRIYLTYDLKWNDSFSGRFRLEAKDAGFGGKDKMVPFVKNAYLRYRKNDRAVYFGLFGTPTWNVSERVWGYRSIEMTILDHHKFGSSADLGVGFNGKLDDGGMARAQVMLGNGGGQNAEVDNGKKIYALLHLKPVGSIEGTAYVDWEGKPGGKDKATFAVFLGMSGKAFHGGIEGFVRIHKKAADGEDVQIRGISVFGAAGVAPKAKMFGRVDIYDPSDRAAEDGEYLVIAGIDLMPIPDVHVMPNVWARAFQAQGVEAEVIPRLTLFYKF